MQTHRKATASAQITHNLCAFGVRQMCVRCASGVRLAWSQYGIGMRRPTWRVCQKNASDIPVQTL